MSKIPGFSKKLNVWYRKECRDLPWRRTTDPYKIWVSEIMLQQTTVNAVIPYYKKWVKEFPTIRSVARAPLQKILKMWQGLGYYQRAKNLHKSAKIICSNFNGKLPDSAEDLRRLAGFGPYTIGAVLSIAFDKRYPIIDANIRRVVMRLLGVEGFADVSKDKVILEFLDSNMPQRNLRTFNQALMELGALVCRNKEPLCSLCPVKARCRAYAKRIQEIIPTPKIKIIKDLDVSIGVIIKNRKYLIQKRPSRGLLADLWEFPGGKIKPQESVKQALKRELKEEIGAEVESSEFLMNARHFYTQYRVCLHVFLCRLKSYPTGTAVRKWVSLDKLSNYPMPSGSAKIVDKLVKLYS